MPVLPEFADARYYLTYIGDLVFSTVELDLIGKIFKKQWIFKSIGQSPEAFFEFLKEAKMLGAREDEIIRLIAESSFETKMPNVLAKLGIHGKRIIYERRPMKINPVNL
jgi:hypothetical protein